MIKRTTMIIMISLLMVGGIGTAQAINLSSAEIVDISMGAITDTDVWSAFPNTNYHTSEVLTVEPNSQMGYMKINVSSIPQTANITSANIYYYAAGAGATISVYNVTSDYNIATVTWNTRPTNASSPFVVATETLTAGYAWHSQDITGLVKGWHNGTIPQNGIALTSDIVAGINTIDKEATPSRKPYLHVVYKPATAENIIKNPSFEEGKAYWTFYTNGIGSLTIENNVAKLNIKTKGTNTQLYQKGVVLEPNTKYGLTFAAKASKGHDLKVVLIKHNMPYINYGLAKTFDLGMNWKEYSIEFTTKGFVNPVIDGRLMFSLSPYGTAGEVYYIDNVILEKVQR